MLVRTDDEVYRVDAVWLGPPRATFPWRARYVSYGVGLLVIMLIMMVQRRLGIGLDFFSVAWALVGTVAVTRLLGKKIGYERPLGQVLAQFWAEVTGPRAGRKAAGGSVRAGHVRVHGSLRGTLAARPARRGRTDPEPWRGSGARRGAVPSPGAPLAASPAPASPAPASPVPAFTSGPFGKPVATRGPFVTSRVAGPAPARGGAAAAPGATSGPFGKPVATKGPLVTSGGAGDADASGSGEPQRVVPPLPEPGSAPRRGRLRAARGGRTGRPRPVTDPARTRLPDPWRRDGHRGRT